MSLTQNDLQAIAELMNPLRMDIREMKEDIAEMKTDIDELKSSQKEMRADIDELKSSQKEMRADINELKVSQKKMDTNMVSLKEEIHDLKRLVDKHYSLTEEFYVHQKEYNTRESDQFHSLRHDFDNHRHYISITSPYVA